MEQQNRAQEVVVFVKEMLKQRPSRQMLKIYVIGSTLALLGAIVGLMDRVYTSEEEEHLTGQSTQERQKTLRTETEELGTVLEETTEDSRWMDHTRSTANRVHAS